MSTKINVRSPFYLNLTEPVPPLPQFTCDKANIKNLSINQQGQISAPDLDMGSVISITSTDSDFVNDKFATESTETQRNLTVRIAIPAGFENSADGFLDCNKTVTQPALITTQPTPADPPVTCSGGPTTNGSISAKTLAVDGGSDSINLSSFFNQGSLPIDSYTIYNSKPSLVNASISGTTLSISSNAIGGSSNVCVSASDTGTNSCTATQCISVTVSNPNQAFDCTQKAFTGGSIAQNGTITKPNSVSSVGNIKASSGGSTITSHSANTTGSARDVTLYFDLTAPAGYSNAGSTVECSKTFSQPSSNPQFTCSIANLSGQNIGTKGVISTGTLAAGTISSFSPVSFDPVDNATVRSITFTIDVPAGYSNSGSTINCVVSVTQPAKAQICGSNTFKLSGPKTAASGFCGGTFAVTKTVVSTASDITTALGKQVCESGSPKLGRDFYYAVSVNSVSVGTGTGKFYLWKIDDNGIVQDVAIHNCPTDGGGSGKGNGGSL